MPEYLQRESNKITIANFYEGYELKKYNFDPPYQRRSLWTDEKKSFLIDSILKNYPIPPIFLHQKIDDKTGKTQYDVIDGKQRLTAIVEFIKGLIPISDEHGDEQEISPIGGLYFSDLEKPEFSTFKSRFWRYVIPVEYVDTGDQEVIDSIFDRLNRNGEALTGQELRHSSYYGTPLLNLIESIAKNDFWKDRLIAVDHTRMEEIEFLSELVFLIIEGKELQASQLEIDSLYYRYANDQNIDYKQLDATFKQITEYINSFKLSYDERRIGGVSHLYGLFAFAYHCVKNHIEADQVKTKLNDFYDLWQSKAYDNNHVKAYKDSMSSRTKERGQRRKRTQALIGFCCHCGYPEK